MYKRQELLAAATDSAREQGFTDADRVLSTAHWDTDEDLIRHFLAVLAAGASLVQVTHADPAVLDRRREMEKVSRG